MATPASDGRAAATAAAAAAAAPPSKTPRLDALIDEAWFSKAEDPEAADRIADELVYQTVQPLLDAAANADDRKALSDMARQLAVPEDAKREAMRQADEMTRRVMMPLAHELLRLRGLDREDADPAAVKEALNSAPTPEEAAAMQRAYSEAFDQVVAPQIKQMLEDEGVQVDVSRPESVWEAAQAYIRAAEAQRGDPERPARRAAAFGGVCALLGAAAAVGALRLAAWLRRRRRRRQRAAAGGGSQGSDASAYEFESIAEAD